LSLFAFAVTLSLSRGTTATCENSAPLGFQHLVHPHTWLCAYCVVTETVTASLPHWHVSVPPLNDDEPALTPLSTAGWIETMAIHSSSTLPSSYGSISRRPASTSSRMPLTSCSSGLSTLSSTWLWSSTKLNGMPLACTMRATRLTRRKSSDHMLMCTSKPIAM